MSDVVCPFCVLPPARVVVTWPTAPLVMGLWAGYPLTEGHALVVPRRHVASWFDLTPEEHVALHAGIDYMRERILAAHGPVDGFNLGVNDGPAAGQTVSHLHVHLIPRRFGDVEDPRGGVRWVIPAKAAYWTPAP